MNIDWNVFDKVIYINLKEQNGRKRTIEKEFHELGIPNQKIYRLDASRHLLSHVGHAQSHLKAIETALQKGWGNVLIVRDNMVFNKDPVATERLNDFLLMLKGINWHCALLSAEYQKVITLKSTDKIVKPVNASSPCAYAVQANYLATLRECFAGSVERLLKGGEQDDHAIDAAWLPLMQYHNWIGIYPVAGHQTSGHSGIKAHFYKDLAAIAR